MDSERPVFIFGLPRSGTTLTEQILARHSQVFGAGELPLAHEDLQAVPGDFEQPEPLGQLDTNTARRIAQHHLDRLQELNASALRVADKMPDNYLCLGLLAALFPRAKFIHCRRDLRDVAVSCLMTQFRQISWTNDPDHIAARFHEYQRLMAHWRAVLPVAMLEVDYEETVADLEGVARRLVDWCGLEWEPACLSFHEGKRPVRTASVAQVRQPLYTRSVARWRNYEGALAALFARLEAGRRTLGSAPAGLPFPLPLSGATGAATLPAASTTAGTSSAPSASSQPSSAAVARPAPGQARPVDGLDQLLAQLDAAWLAHQRRKENDTW
jgi:hypothetical protein